MIESTQNPYSDRITELLQRRAQEQAPEISQQEMGSIAANNALNRFSGGPVGSVLQMINDARSQKLTAMQVGQDRELQTQKTLYDQFEEQRAAGSKEAKSLFDSMNMFTDGDPEGNQIFLESLHNDPDDIDPSNTYQVMTKLARIAKMTGYTSPTQKMSALDLKSKKLGLDKTRAEIEKLRNPELASANRTGNIQDFEYYQSLSPDQQSQYDALHGIRQSEAIPENPAEDEIVNAIIEGRMALPVGTALKTGYWQNILEKVAVQDPKFDLINFQARQRARIDATSGSVSKNITAMNTVLGHLGSLSDAAKNLNNTSIRFVNYSKNELSKAAGSPEVTNFDTVKKAVADELAKVFSGTGGALADREEWVKKIETLSSPQQIDGFIASATDLLESRLRTVEDQYAQGIGTKPIRVLNKSSQEVFDKFSNNGDAKPELNYNPATDEFE